MHSSSPREKSSASNVSHQHYASSFTGYHSRGIACVQVQGLDLPAQSTARLKNLNGLVHKPIWDLDEDSHGMNRYMYYGNYELQRFCLFWPFPSIHLSTYPKVEIWPRYIYTYRPIINNRKYPPKKTKTKRIHSMIEDINSHCRAMLDLDDGCCCLEVDDIHRDTPQQPPFSLRHLFSPSSPSPLPLHPPCLPSKLHRRSSSTLCSRPPVSLSPTVSTVLDARVQSSTPRSSLSHQPDLTSKLTDFRIPVYADWCGPCKAIAPVYDSLSTQLSRPNHITFTKINGDEQQALAQAYFVSAYENLRT